MSPLPTQEELRQRKLDEHAELERQRQRELAERRGFEEACARYWELLEEFVVRAVEIGVQPERYGSTSQWRAGTRVAWVEGFRLRSGSIVSVPPLRYCLRERRLVSGPRTEEHEVQDVTLFVLSTDAGLAAGLSGPKTASQGTWPPTQRWDRAANLLLALEAELEATLLELMEMPRLESTSLTP
jgi:hypothetical protein